MAKSKKTLPAKTQKETKKPKAKTKSKALEPAPGRWVAPLLLILCTLLAASVHVIWGK